MADIFVKRDGEFGDKLIPTDEESLKIVKKLSRDEVYKMPIKKTRNYQFHKKYFALLNTGWDNSPLNVPFNKFREYCMIGAGHCTVVGGHAIADSISFDNMDDLEFEQVYSDVLQFIILHIGADQKTIEDNLINFM